MKTTVRTLTFSTNYVPLSPFASKGGGRVMTPSSYGCAAPAIVLCDLLDNRFFGHSTFVLLTVDMERPLLLK